MKIITAFSRIIVMIAGLLSSFSLFSLHSLMRDYKKFEELIINNEPVIYFDENDGGSCESNEKITRSVFQQKNWTFIVYMASDNDLRAFAANNIKQMASLGSNQHVNIVIHLDIRLNGNQKVTRRYYVEQNKITHLNKEPATQRMDSGDPKTLISACDWAIRNFPAQKYALILWNHGTGIIDPKHYKIINPAELFSFNPRNQKLELDRSIPFLDFLYFADLDQRGICWDNSTGNYLSNEKLNQALTEVCGKILKRKFDLIGFDACLMSMVEVSHMIKNYAHFMVGSQEVELGTGWHYGQVLQPLISGQPVSAAALAQHIVGAYKKSYDSITNDFTQSAFDLNKAPELEKNIDAVARLLLEGMRHQVNNSIYNAVKASKNKKDCTHFDEPSYIDLHHFYCNLQNRIQHCSIKSPHQNIIKMIQDKLVEGKKIISQMVFAHIAGNNLKLARGISIYFPDNRIHASYPKSPFAQQSNWYQLINSCR